MKMPSSLYETQFANLSSLFPLTNDNHIKIDFGKGLSIPFIHLPNQDVWVDAWPLTVTELFSLVDVTKMQDEFDHACLHMRHFGNGRLLTSDEDDAYCFTTKGCLATLCTALQTVVMKNPLFSAGKCQVRVPSRSNINDFYRQVFKQDILPEGCWTKEMLSSENDSVFGRVRFVVSRD